MSGHSTADMIHAHTTSTLVGLRASLDQLRYDAREARTRADAKINVLDQAINELDRVLHDLREGHDAAQEADQS